MLPNKNIVINVTLSNDAEVQELNQKYFDRDYPTDVLSFSINEDLEDGSYYLGDIVVNKDQAQRQSSEYSNTFEEEISALVEHGILHLLGVHHPHDDEHDVHGVSVKDKK